MKLGDYDRDGSASEFVLRIGSEACRSTSVIVGVSRLQPELHVFTTEERPDSPLIVAPEYWDTLLRSGGKTTVEEMLCGDHGSMEQSEIELKAKEGALHAERKRYKCTDSGERGRLTGTEVL
ncbi:MAG TPA: hypothetical protein VG389_11825 [Myxococcota bacterium]|jgi:hypothetical protein|nr:hypothetical protein [Myxococcota bacterium]